MADYKNVAGATVFLACAGLCASFEGLDTRAYHDTLAHGLPTVCYGETEGVKMSDVYTPDECKVMLANKLPRYWEEISRCIRVPISDNEKTAYIDFAYNVGSAAFCYSKPYDKKHPSTLLKHLNAGDHKGACDVLMSWDHAGGKQVRGLTRRRAAERALCLTPDTEPMVTPAPIPPPKPTIAPPEPPKKAPVCRRFFFFWKVCK